MAYENLGESLLDYMPCRYGKSKLLFRGPRRRLNGDYIAFLGGTETYGKFIEVPFAALVEEQTGTKTVNFGCVNAGADVYYGDRTVLDACSGARVTVVEVMGAQNMSNRFYSVHPRRNDRFLRASTLMQTIYREVDFTEYNFTRHLLTSLHALSPERFEIVRQELKDAWVARMRQMLEKIGGKIILLWLADHPPETGGDDDADQLGQNPLFIDAAMINQLRQLVTEVAVVCPSKPAMSRGTDGMIFSPMEEPAAAELLGVGAHQETAKALSALLKRMV